MDRLRWDDVPLFLALYRERNLLGAGRRMGLDASTASRRLASLEEATGARLFDRTRQGLAPTEAAEGMLPAAEEMERASIKLANAAQARQAGVEGVVRIAAIPGVADFYLAPRLPELLARHPGLRVELDVRIQVSDLTRREADVALRSIRPQSGELVMKRLLTARWLAMASADLAAALGTLRRWDDARWITWDDDLAHIPSARWVSKHASGAAPVLKTSSIGSMVAAVKSGVGVALLDEYTPTVHPGLAPVRYARELAPSAAEWPEDDLWLVGHAALRDTPRVAAVWSFLEELFEEATRPPRPSPAEPRPSSSAPPTPRSPGGARGTSSRLPSPGRPPRARPRRRP
ncbi:MAG: LysR family transcriptional regulator [Polyangiaceae bacterium]